MKTRDQIEEKYKLDVKGLFTSEEKFLEELENLKNDINEIKKFEGHILDSSDNLLNLYKLSEDLDSRIEKVYVYASLNHDFDLADEKGDENYGKAYKLYQEYNNLSAFITPELLKNDYSVIEKYINENKELKKYEIVLKEIFRLKEHILDKNEELILSKLSNALKTPYSAYSKLTDVDLKFGKVKDEDGKNVELSEANWSSFIESKSRNVRKNAFKKFFGAYKSVINSTAELLSSQVKQDNAMANIRKYDNAMNASLNVNDVDSCVYNNLINAINKNMNILHRQWDIRKKVLGIKELHLYDTYVPLVREYNKKYSYEDAKELVLKSLSVLGEDYCKVLKRFFDERWIDVYPNENKRGGAYCTCCYLTNPYVVTNFNERYGSVSTITHELGHGMHYHYAQTNNRYYDYGYTIFVAEVASQVNEILLALHILNTSDDKNEKIFVLDELIKHFKSSVVRQTMFAEFEKEIHEKEQNGDVLTCNYLCDAYYDLNKRYFGKNVVVDEEIKYEWSRIPHFYYNFYVYQYSTGYIAALKIASDIFNKKENALDKYLEFLKLGCTKDPVESLKIAGVDLTKETAFDEAFIEFNKQMDEFEKLIGKE